MKKYLVSLAVAFGMLLSQSSANAAFRLRVEDTGANVGAVLTGTVVVANNPSGTISFSATVGSFSLVVAVANTLHSAPSNYGQLDLVGVSITSTGAGTLRITVEDTDYNRGGNPLQSVAMVGGVVGAGGTLTAQSWVDGTNDVPDLGADIGSISSAVALGGNVITGLPTAGGVASFAPAGGIVFGPGAFSATGGASFTSGPPTLFSIYSQVTITAAGAGSITSFNFDTHVVPVPAGLLLAVSALPMLGFGWLRRRRQLATIA